MHAIDIVLIIVIAGAVLAAVNSIRKQKKNGGVCTGNCTDCGRGCK